MEKQNILSLSKKINVNQNIAEIKNFLEKNNYEISFGAYENFELKKALQEKKPVIIKNHFIIGYEDDHTFIDIDNRPVRIERLVKAVIVEGGGSDPISREVSPELPREQFSIIGKIEWDKSTGFLSEFSTIFDRLKVGEIFLPPHSAIFNFLVPTDDLKKKKVVSMLDGVKVNLYTYDNFIDNSFHEIGHLFWRDCVTAAEKKAFFNHHRMLRPSAIYEYDWERSDCEEVFCTIYKWYLKSILLNKSFYNILEFEEPRGLVLLQSVFDRIAKDKMRADIWQMSEADVMEYINPVYDKTTGKYLRKAGLFEKVKDIEIPADIRGRVEFYIDGVEYISLEKAIVPVKGNLIDWQWLEKKKLIKSSFIHSEKQEIFCDLDGVVADFAKGYRKAFNRDVYAEDTFTVTQFCMQVPDFFRNLPVIEKGRELVDILSDKYTVIFLSTPMDDLPGCRRDKLEWVKENFGDHYDVIFSHSKADYAEDEKSILIDDMAHNLGPWADAGGTAIDFNRNRVDDIIEKIDEALYGKKEVETLTEKLKKIVVNTEPTEKQKGAGNYSKGDIIFKKIPVTIENVPGSIRFGFDDRGQKWVNKMKAYYGYVKRTEGADGDHIDCFIGPKLNASRAFVINQNKPDGMFDEVKIIFGCDDIDEAMKLYLSHYPKGWERNIGGIIPTNTKKVRDWLAGCTRFDPFPSDK